MDSEFEFIRSILHGESTGRSVIVPNGDDAAVVRCGGELVAVSVDAIVEGTHFSFDFSSSAQVGIKAVESSISDIVAMGGTPKFVLVSMVAPSAQSLDRLGEIFGGIRQACTTRGIVILGGNTTRGQCSLTVSITAVGTISDETRIRRRSDAQEGDLVYISGPLGGSAAGLLALQHHLAGLGGVKERYREPRSRVDLAPSIGEIANAVIDVSDGLSSELHHICKASKVGCLVYEDRIPLSDGVLDVATHLGLDPYELAWNGGEDYELLFTVSKDRVAERTSKLPGVLIGEITQGSEVLCMRSDTVSRIEPRGYDHFRKAT